MIFVRYYNHFCPNCRKVWSTTLSADPTRLGKGSRECKKCHTVFPDGSKEWPEQSAGRKWYFFIPNGVMIVLGLALVCAAAMYAVGENTQDSIGGAVFVFLLFLVPIIPFWLVQLVRMRKSVDRYHGDAKARAAGGTIG